MNSGESPLKLEKHQKNYPLLFNKKSPVSNVMFKQYRRKVIVFSPFSHFFKEKYLAIASPEHVEVKTISGSFIGKDNKV